MLTKLTKKGNYVRQLGDNSVVKCSKVSVQCSTVSVQCIIVPVQCIVVSVHVL